MNTKPLALSLLTSFGLLTSAASADSVSLAGWQHIGGTGTWTLAANNQSVTKTQNRGPSYFVSNDSFSNTRVSGVFGVDTWADDDFIGMAFGWNQPGDLATASFFLLHWKQEAQNGSDAGFTLAKVTGAETPPSRNAQTSTSNYQVLASNTGQGLGWQDETRYGFEVEYTDHNMSVVIKDLPDKTGRNFTRQFGLEGTEVLNVDGDFQDGRFAFYNQSQTKSYYGNLTREAIVKPQVLEPIVVSLSLVATPVPAPAAAGAGLIGCLGLVARRRRTA